MGFKTLINYNPLSTQVQDELRNEFRSPTNRNRNIDFVTDKMIEEYDLNSMAKWSSQSIPTDLNLTVGSCFWGSTHPKSGEKARIDPLCELTNLEEK